MKLEGSGIKFFQQDKIHVNINKHHLIFSDKFVKFYFNKTFIRLIKNCLLFGLKVPFTSKVSKHKLNYSSDFTKLYFDLCLISFINNGL